MKRFLSLSLMLFLVTAFSVSCTQKKNDNEILLGSYSSNTGATATFGIYQMRGIEMAIEEINKAGGIKGKMIKHINYDNKSDDNETLSVVKRLINQDGVVALLGEITSGRSKIGAGIAQENKVPTAPGGSRHRSRSVTWL